MVILKNSKLNVQIDTLGAELKGIYSLDQEIEYMWQPGYDIWDHSSLLLFPNASRICRDRAIIGGKVYPATMHGFAYTSEFSVVSQCENSATLELTANETTKKYFPYNFVLDIDFAIEENILTQRLRVKNKDSIPMYFSIGAHPGFYLPLDIGESGDDYILHFNSPQDIDQMRLQRGTNLYTEENVPYLRNETDIALSENFFDDGPKVLSGVKADSITLLSKKSGRFVKLGIKDFPYLCLWGNPHKNAMICIEPWCGAPDSVNSNHVWETKLGIEKVEPGEEFSRIITFEVG